MGLRSVANSSLPVLDAEGTITRVYRDDERAEHPNDAGWTSWMRVNEGVIDALDATAHRPDIRVVWLTTWPLVQVSWLIAGAPLRGRLVGPTLRLFAGRLQRLGPFGLRRLCDLARDSRLSRRSHRLPDN